MGNSFILQEGRDFVVGHSCMHFCYDTRKDRVGNIHSMLKLVYLLRRLADTQFCYLIAQH